jgi:hypothetical protein
LASFWRFRLRSTMLVFAIVYRLLIRKRLIAA